jgi:transposase
MLLTSRKLLQRKLLDMECDLRGTLRNFGLKVGVVSTGKFEARIRELVTGSPRLALIVEPLLAVRRVMRQQFAVLHKMLLDTVCHDPVCRRFMTAPGVGVVVALTYRATVDQPQRFVYSRAVGAHVGLTPRRHQSGEITAKEKERLRVAGHGASVPQVRAAVATAQHFSPTRSAAITHCAAGCRPTLDRRVLSPGDGAQLCAGRRHQPSRSPGADIDRAGSASI